MLLWICNKLTNSLNSKWYSANEGSGMLDDKCNILLVHENVAWKRNKFIIFLKMGENPTRNFPKLNFRYPYLQYIAHDAGACKIRASSSWGLCFIGIGLCSVPLALIWLISVESTFSHCNVTCIPEWDEREISRACYCLGNNCHVKDVSYSTLSTTLCM